MALLAFLGPWGLYEASDDEVDRPDAPTTADIVRDESGNGYLILGDPPEGAQEYRVYINGRILTVQAARGRVSFPMGHFFGGDTPPADAEFRIDVVIDGVGSVPLYLTRAEEAAPVSAPTVIEPPAIIGDVLIGRVTTAYFGDFTDMRLAVPTIEWLIDDVPVPGATGETYRPVAADDLKALKVRVTADNGVGSPAVSTSAGVTVTYAKPVIETPVEDLALRQGDPAVVLYLDTRFRTIDETGAPSLAGTTFSLSGTDVTLDVEARTVTIGSAVLRTDSPVTITASNSGGDTDLTFAVTVTTAGALPEFPPPLGDEDWYSREVRDSEPTGRRRLDVDGDVEVPAGFELRWYSGYTNGGVTSTTSLVTPGTPVTTGSGHPIGARMHDVLFWKRLEDGAFQDAYLVQVEYVLKGLYPQPTLVEPISAKSAVVGGPPIVFDASLAFYPEGADPDNNKAGATFSIAGGGSIDPATGLVTHATGSAVAPTTITVTATTVGGARDAPYTLEIVASGGATPFPPDVPSSKWSDGEQRLVAPAGRFTCTIDPSLVIPEGFELYWSPTANPEGVPEWARKMDPGDTYTTNSTSSIGTTIYTMLFWRRGEGGAFARCSEVREYVVQGLVSPPDTGGDVPLVSSTALDPALNDGVLKTRHNGDYYGTRSPANYGPLPVILAARRMAGAHTATEDKLKTQIDASLAGDTGPLCLTGYTAQYDLMHVSMFALIRNTPAFWNGAWMNSSNRKAKIDALMEAAVVGGAWASCDKNGGGNVDDFLGYSHYNRGWAPNFRLAMVGTLLAAIPYYGGASAVLSLLNNASISSLKSRLNSLDLTNAHKSIAGIGSASGAPSVSQVQNAISGYKYRTRSLSDIFGICKVENDNMWGKPISAGLNNGNGASYTRTKNGKKETEIRGVVMSGKSTLPNVGLTGLGKEFDVSDGSCRRSSFSYVVGGARCELMYLCVLAATGYLTPDIAGMSAFMAQTERGYNDLLEKDQRGYKSVAKCWGGTGGSENWTHSWGVSNYRFPATPALFYDFLNPLLT